MWRPELPAQLAKEKRPNTSSALLDGASCKRKNCGGVARQPTGNLRTSRCRGWCCYIGKYGLIFGAGRACSLFRLAEATRRQLHWLCDYHHVICRWLRRGLAPAGRPTRPSVQGGEKAAPMGAEGVPDETRFGRACKK